MTTQVIDRDHPILGFSHTWATKIAERIRHLHVLALSVGTHQLPDNVTLWSLGRERGMPRWQRLLRYQRIVMPLLLGKQVDGIFVQQTEINVILTAPYAIARRIPIVLFKGHSKSLRPSLRLANWLITQAITSTEAGYPIRTTKKLVIGQGIDTNFFQPSPAPRLGNTYRIVSVGRLSPIKRYEAQIEAARILVNRGRRDLTFHVYGGWEYPGYEEYLGKLRAFVGRYGLGRIFHFEGHVPFTRIPEVYQSADLVVHTCDNESLDKAVLEAMACAVPVVTSIQSYRSVLGSHADLMVFRPGDATALADRIEALLALSPEERRAIGLKLREIVIRNHSVDRFADKLVTLFENLLGWRTGGHQ